MISNVDLSPAQPKVFKDQKKTNSKKALHQKAKTVRENNTNTSDYKKASFTKRHLFIIAGTFLLFIAAALSFYFFHSHKLLKIISI